MDNTLNMKQTFFEQSQGFVIGAIVMSLLLFFFNATPNAVEKKWQVEAIKHHAAEWVVDNEGNTSFQWKNATYAFPKAQAIVESVENSSSLLLPDEMLPTA